MASAFLLLIAAGETLAQLREHSSSKTDVVGTDVDDPASGSPQPPGTAASKALEPSEVTGHEGGGLSTQVVPSDPSGHLTTDENGDWNSISAKSIKDGVPGPAQNSDKSPDDAAADVEAALKFEDRTGMEEQTNFYVDSVDADDPKKMGKHFLKKREVLAAFKWVLENVAAKRGYLEAKISNLDKKPFQLAELTKSLQAAQKTTQLKFENILEQVHAAEQDMASRVDKFTSDVAQKTDPESAHFNTWNYTANAVMLEKMMRATEAFRKSSTSALAQMNNYLKHWLAVGQHLHYKEGQRLSDWAETFKAELSNWKFHEEKSARNKLEQITDKKSVAFAAIKNEADNLDRRMSQLLAAADSEVLEQTDTLAKQQKVFANEAARVKTLLNELLQEMTTHDKKFNKKVEDMKEAIENKAGQIRDNTVSKLELVKVQSKGEFQEVLRQADVASQEALRAYQKKCDELFEKFKNSDSGSVDSTAFQNEMNEDYARLTEAYTNMQQKNAAADITGKKNQLSDGLADMQNTVSLALSNAQIDAPKEFARLNDKMLQMQDFLLANIHSEELNAKLDVAKAFGGIDNEVERLAESVNSKVPDNKLPALIQMGDRAMQDVESVRFEDVMAPILMEQQRLLHTKEQIAKLADQAAKQQHALLSDAAKQLSERSGSVPGSLAQLAGTHRGPDALVQAEERVKQRLPKDLQDWSAQMSARIGRLVDAWHEVGPDLKSLSTLRGNGVSALQPLLPKAEPSERIAKVFDKLEAAAKVTASMPRITDQANKEWAAGLQRRMEAALAASGQSLQQFVERGLGAPDMHAQVQEASSWLEASRTTQKARELQGDLSKHMTDMISPVNAAARRVAVSSAARLETEEHLFTHTQQALDLLARNIKHMRQRQSQAHSDVAVAVGEMAEKVEQKLSRSNELDLSSVKKPLQQEMDELGQMNSYLGLVLPDSPQEQLSAVSKELEQLKSAFDQAKGEAQVLAQQREQLLEQHKAAPRYVDARVMDEFGRPQIKVPGRKPLITESLGAVDDAIGLLNERLQSLPDKLSTLMPTRDDIDSMLPHVEWPDVGVAMDALDDITSLRAGDALVNAAALDERRVDDFEVKMAKLAGPGSDAEQALRSEKGEVLGTDINGELMKVKQKGLANNAALEQEAEGVRQAAFEKLSTLATGATKIAQAALPQWRTHAKTFDDTITELEKKESAMSAWQKSQQSANSQLEAEDEAWHEKIAKVLDQREAPKTQTLLEQLQQRSKSRAALDEKREEHVKALESKMRALHT